MGKWMGGWMGEADESVGGWKGWGDGMDGGMEWMERQGKVDK